MVESSRKTREAHKRSTREAQEKHKRSTREAQEKHKKSTREAQEKHTREAQEKHKRSTREAQEKARKSVTTHPSSSSSVPSKRTFHKVGDNGQVRGCLNGGDVGRVGVGWWVCVSGWVVVVVVDGKGGGGEGTQDMDFSSKLLNVVETYLKAFGQQFDCKLDVWEDGVGQQTGGGVRTRGEQG